MSLDDDQGRRLLAMMFEGDAEVEQASLDWPDHRDGDDRYTPQNMLGRGGMGEVWASRDRYLDRSVAMKVLVVEEPEWRARFLREARITARLDHPNIMPVHDIGVDAEGRRYFTMKRVRGGSLRDAITAQQLGGMVQRIDVFRKVCNAVEFAHAQGVVHRDLKPANVMVGPQGEVLLCDWGLARELDREAESHDSTLLQPTPSSPWETQHGAVLGTPAFMAPEQARGDNDLITEATDIYALGALLFTLLGGASPNTPDLKGALAGVPRELKHVVAKAMSHEPADRYGSVSELDAHIVAWLEGRTIDDLQYSPLERAARWATRHKSVVRTTLAVGALAAVLVAGLTQRYLREVTEARDEAVAEAIRAEKAHKTALQRELEGHVALATVRVDQGHIEEARSELAFAYDNAAELGTPQLSVELGASYVDARSPPPVIEWAHPEGKALTRALLSDDARTVVTLDSDGLVRTHDLRTGELRTTKQLQKDGFVGLVQADGSFWTIEGGGGGVVVRELPTGVTLYKTPRIGRVDTAYVAGGVAVFADAVAGSTVLLPQQVVPIPEAQAPMCLSADGGRLVGYEVIGGRNRFPDEVIVWDTATARALAKLPASTHAACSPDGSRVALLSKGVEVFDLNTGERKWAASPPNPSQLRYDRKGRELMVWTHEGRLHRYDADTGQSRGEQRLPLGHVFHSAVEPWLLSHAGDRWALWPLSQPTNETHLTSKGLTSVDVGPGGVLMAAGGMASTVQVLDAVTGRVVRTLPTSTLGTRDVRFSTDGDRLLVAGRDGVALVFDLGDGQITHRLEAPSGAIAMAGAWRGEGVLVAYGNGDLVEWDLRTSQALRLLRGRQTQVWDLDVDSTGRYALTTGRGADPQGVVWDLETGKQAVVFDQHEGEAYGGAIGPDGRVMVGNHEGKPWVAHLRAQATSTLTDLYEVVLSVAFSADGRMLIGGTLDGRLVFWDSQTFVELHSFRLEDSPVVDLAVMPDGTIVAAGGGGTLRRFDPQLAAKLAQTAITLRDETEAPLDYQQRLASRAIALQWYDLASELMGAEMDPLTRARAAQAAGHRVGSEAAMGEAVEAGLVTEVGAAAWLGR